MEQQKQSLPSNIDSQVLKLTSDNGTVLNSIAEGWKALVATIEQKDAKIKELEALIEEQKGEGEND